MRQYNLLIHAMLQPYTDAVMIAVLTLHGFFISISAKCVVHDELYRVG